MAQTNQAQSKVDTRIQRNRESKARRYVERFLHQMRGSGVVNPETNKEALEVAIGLARGATAEQWEALAKDLTQENEATARKSGLARWKVEDPPSATTQILIVEQMQFMLKHADYEKSRQQNEKDLDAETFGTLSRWVGRQYTAEERELAEPAVLP